MTQTTKDNPDRALIAQVLAEGLREVDVHSSALLSALKCQIVSVVPGKIQLRFEPGAAYEQGNGVVCGGIGATMLDFGLAFAALSTCTEGESAMSVGLNVQYIAPVFPGEVFVDASLVSAGFRLSQAEARLADATGKLLATANGPLAMKRRSTR